MFSSDLGTHIRMLTVTSSRQVLYLTNQSTAFGSVTITAFPWILILEWKSKQT
jgi:hypothetical protein